MFLWRNEKNHPRHHQIFLLNKSSGLGILASTLLGTMWVTKDPTFLLAVSKDTDQGAWMHMLTFGVFIVCTSDIIISVTDKSLGKELNKLLPSF